MDFRTVRAAAQAAVDPLAWAYIEATATEDAALGDPGTRQVDPNTAAWQRFSLLPRVLTGAQQVDQTTLLPEALHRGGATLRTPVMVAPTARQEMSDPAGEVATARAAAAAGALMVYSMCASVEVTAFGAAAPGPWWAQLYLQADRARSYSYLERAAAAGAGAVVLTVDLAGTGAGADPTFRRTVQRRMEARLGNFPGLEWSDVSASYAQGYGWEAVTDIASRTGLPVHVKGILHPDDAALAAEFGAASVIVSNHGRRQLDGVIATADALGPIVDAVDGRVPVLVDGGIRSGADVARALALGATLVGVGRPVVWGLSAAGQDGAQQVLDGLTQELRQAMAALGAERASTLGRDHVRHR